MTHSFQGWTDVAARLRRQAQGEDSMSSLADAPAWLNAGQCAGLRAIADRIESHGVIIADEVGMGKTRVAVALVSAVVGARGRVAVVVPPVLGYQWQDELAKGAAPSPGILRSLGQYLDAWKIEANPDHHPWFNESVVLLSQSFANWRLGPKSEYWRWGILPEIYSLWRKQTSESGRLPRGSRSAPKDHRVERAAQSIIRSVSEDENDPSRKLLNEMASKTPWPAALEAGAYGKGDELRIWLEKAVGLGLGHFDLIVIDEAHKSRGEASRLNALLQNIVQANPDARRFGMTATPVELDASQWKSTLSRIGLSHDALCEATRDVEAYASAVREIRLRPTDPELRRRFPTVARNFEVALSPYVIRRDKREDDAVRRFSEAGGGRLVDYRTLSDVVIDPSGLSMPWRQAICAAEALSWAARGGDAERLKRLRLTLGNGHGIAALLDEPLLDHDEDREEAEPIDETVTSPEESNSRGARTQSKREQRLQWWQEVARLPFAGAKGDEALFDHPTILATIRVVEEVLDRGEKVLVFGRFTRPLRRLTELLNARAMLKALEYGESWPQEKVHGDRTARADVSDWPAVFAAHKQRACTLPRDDIDRQLEQGYAKLQRRRDAFRGSLIGKLREGLEVESHRSDKSAKRTRMLFHAFTGEVAVQTADRRESHALSVVGRAMEDAIGLKHSESARPSDLWEAFGDLMQALSERDEGDQDGDGQLQQSEADRLWPSLRERLDDDYSTVRGGMARLMYGGTSPHSRRMMQLAFNRLHSPTRVLVAQSMVGREGLNLHKACRTVILLHPEWNPGVVEQQIGRVDRVGSFWQRCLEDALAKGSEFASLPRIEVRPVVFRGTYDEYNWQVLKERWKDLRAQLHGMVITADEPGDSFMSKIIEEINAVAPTFSPLRSAVDHSNANQSS